jgi:hypothetical protein
VFEVALSVATADTLDAEVSVTMTLVSDAGDALVGQGHGGDHGGISIHAVDDEDDPVART